MASSTVDNVYAIIPVRNLNKSKSRLTDILTGDLRKELNWRMLLNVIKACLKTGKLEKVIIVSPDVEVLKFSEENGAETLNEGFERGVNGAVSFAKEKLVRKPSSILILPSDLPLVTCDELSTIISLGGKSPSIVISPSSRLDGTNALLLNPPDAIPTFFDQNSFTNHLNVAVKKHVKAAIYISRRIILDIDTPRDLREFLKYRESESYKIIREHLNRSFLPRT